MASMGKVSLSAHPTRCTHSYDRVAACGTLILNLGSSEWVGGGELGYDGRGGYGWVFGCGESCIHLGKCSEAMDIECTHRRCTFVVSLDLRRGEWVGGGELGHDGRAGTAGFLCVGGVAYTCGCAVRRWMLSVHVGVALSWLHWTRVERDEWVRFRMNERRGMVNVAYQHFDLFISGKCHWECLDIYVKGKVKH